MKPLIILGATTLTTYLTIHLGAYILAWKHFRKG